MHRILKKCAETRGVKCVVQETLLILTGRMGSKSLNYYVTWWLLFLGWAVANVEAQRRRDSTRRGRRPSKGKRGKASAAGKRPPFYGWRFILFLFLLCFIPPVSAFVYNLYKDPMAPTLWKNGLEFMREKMLGFLAKVNQPTRRRKAE